MKKNIILILLAFSLIFGGKIVFGNFSYLENDARFFDITNKFIMLDDKDLRKSVVAFSSSTDIRGHSIFSPSCNVSSSFFFEEDNIYYFNLELAETACYNNNFFLTDGKVRLLQTHFQLDIQDGSETFSSIIDYNTAGLRYAYGIVDKKLAEISKALTLPAPSLFGYMSQQKNIKRYRRILYKKGILETILKRRVFKYSLPVQGHHIARGSSIIPNAPRNYRKAYTDGIHHGWDIMAPKGTPVLAIDTGIVIRVVNGFTYGDLGDIKKGKGLSYSQKLRNLDILRGNQVWLKTTKGDVVFYSHLNKIYSNIQEGGIIKVNTPIGTIGKTGIPGRNYSNYHLHFPIQKNPYNIHKVGQYSFEDYMGWDWYLKGLTEKEVLEGQKLIFNG